MKKFYSINEEWLADDRRKLLVFARDLLNSDYAGHRLTFQLFAQSPPFANLAAVYRNFDWGGPFACVTHAAGLSSNVTVKDPPVADSSVKGLFSSGPRRPSKSATLSEDKGDGASTNQAI